MFGKIFASVFFVVLLLTSCGMNEANPYYGTTYGTGTTVSGTVMASYASLEQNLFVPVCATCHSGSHAPGGFVANNYQSVRSMGVSAYRAMLSGRMPPDGNGQVTQADVNALYTWLTQGGPNN